MAYYATLPNGKIKYYWEDNINNPDLYINDPLDGVNGVRKWLLDVIPDNESILDIGCGSGHVSEIFKRANRNNEYVGIDNDIKFIEQARVLFPSYKFDLQDANFLPYQDNSFDNVVLFTVIEMVSDFRKAVEEAVRVAKKRIIITTFVPMLDIPDRNKHKVNIFGDYVVNINKDKFLKHISSLGVKVTSGELGHEGKIQYWYWILEK